MKKNILIEGWRGISHSYALVNQNQLLNINNDNHNIYHRDMPYHFPHWNLKDQFSGFDELELKKINSYQPPSSTHKIDIVYRIYSPINFKSLNNVKTFIFCPSETQHINDEYFSKNLDSIIQGDINFICPTRWASFAFLNRGIQGNRVHVVGHGVNNKFYRFENNLRDNYREKFGFKDDDFVIFSVNSMHHMKGPDLLLKSFLTARNKNKKIKLLIKDQKSLYNLDAISYIKNWADREKIILNSDTMDSIKVVSGNLSPFIINIMYNIADCYVSPYRAEGFNLPPLEATATGLPIVVTSGGSTDDFFPDCYGYQINSRIIKKSNMNYLEPSLEDLTDKIIDLVSKNDRYIVSSKQLELFKNKYAWSNIAEKLINVITN